MLAAQAIDLLGAARCIESLSLACSPAVVLDPFSGAGTTGVVAVRLKRQFVGIEMNSDYVDLAERRLNGCASADRYQASE